MSFICDNCEKGVVFGRSQKHGRGIAGKRWKKRAPETSRTFKPNLQKVSFLVEGKKQSFRLCAKCLKKLKKEKVIQYSSVNSALG